LGLLLLEDDQFLAEKIIAALQKEGFAVNHASDGLAGSRLAQNNLLDLVILELALPRRNGRTILRDLRDNKRNTPVFIIAAESQRGAVVELLDSGADDYLTKPFDFRELLARVKALIRRSKGTSKPVVQISDLELDTVRQTLKRKEVEIELSPSEYRIMEYLALRPGAIISKQELREHMHHTDWKHPSNVIEAHISNLRKKLQVEGREWMIETFRHRGYRFNDGEL
jgi:two-component system response regulator PhoP